MGVVGFEGEEEAEGEEEGQGEGEEVEVRVLIIDNPESMWKAEKMDQEGTMEKGMREDRP